MTLSVDPEAGKDTFPGTAAQPLQSLRQALLTAQAGDIIELAPGTYVLK